MGVVDCNNLNGVVYCFSGMKTRQVKNPKQKTPTQLAGVSYVIRSQEVGQQSKALEDTGNVCFSVLGMSACPQVPTPRCQVVLQVKVAHPNMTFS